MMDYSILGRRVATCTIASAHSSHLLPNGLDSSPKVLGGVVANFSKDLSSDKFQAFKARQQKIVDLNEVVCHIDNI